MVSNYYNGGVDTFLCYRNNGAPHAKALKEAFEHNKNKFFGSVWYSDRELGNYDKDIEQLITEKTKFAILFIEFDFTKGFLDDPNCITRKEMIQIEKMRQKGNLKIVTININGYKFSEDDINTLKKIFKKAGILSDDTIGTYETSNVSNFNARQDYMSEWITRIEDRFVIEEYFDPNSIKKELSMLKSPLTNLYEMDENINKLNDFYKNHSCLNIYGEVGTGKSTLLYNWINNSLNNRPEFQYVFYWSFDVVNTNYSLSGNLSIFFEKILDFFSIKVDGLNSDVEKAYAIGSFLNEKKAILILDGLDVFLSKNKNSIDEQSIKRLVDFVKYNNNKKSFLILVSILPISDLQEEARFSIPRLKDSSYISILREIGLTNSDNDLLRIAKSLKFNLWAITLYGNVLKNQTNLPANKLNIDFINVNVDPIDSILDIYDKAYSLDSLNGKILLLSSAFLHDIDVEILRDYLNYNYQDWNIKKEEISRLNDIILEFKRIGFAYGENSIRFLPNIRKYYNDKFKETKGKLYCEFNFYLADFFQRAPDDLITTISDMIPLYDSVYYYIQAKKYSDAINLFWERIIRKRTFFSQKKLGAFANDLFVTSLFFDAEGQWIPNENINKIDAAWLTSVAAYLLNVTGNLSKSETLRLKELDIYRQMGNNKSYIADIVNLASNYMIQGKLQESTDCFKEALTRMDEPMTEINSKYSERINILHLRANTISKYSYLLYHLGKTEEAKKYIDGINTNDLSESVSGRFFYCYMKLLMAEDKLHEVAKEVSKLINPIMEGKNYDSAYIHLINAKLRYVDLKGFNKGNKIKTTLDFLDKAINKAQEVHRVDQLSLVLVNALKIYTELYLQTKGKKDIIAKIDQVIDMINEIRKEDNIPFYYADYMFNLIDYYVLCKKDYEGAKELYDKLRVLPICLYYYKARLTEVSKKVGGGVE